MFLKLTTSSSLNIDLTRCAGDAHFNLIDQHNPELCGFDICLKGAVGYKKSHSVTKL